MPLQLNWRNERLGDKEDDKIDQEKDKNVRKKEYLETQRYQHVAGYCKKNE